MVLHGIADHMQGMLRLTVLCNYTEHCDSVDMDDKARSHLDRGLGPRGRGGNILCVSYPEGELLDNACSIGPGDCDTKQVPAPPLHVMQHACEAQHAAAGPEADMNGISYCIAAGVLCGFQLCVSLREQL